MIPSERASKEEQNGANFSFIAPSCDELWVPTIETYMDGKGRHHSGLRKTLNAHNSSLEGATKLKFAPFCSPCDALSNGILFSKLFLDSKNQTMDYSPWFSA